MGSGYDKAREVANKLKGDMEQTQQLAETKNNEADKLLAQLANNPLLDKFRKNAALGTENLSMGKLPALKIHMAGRSKNKLANGEKPNDGWFYYAPDQSQYKEIHCHILSCSRSYMAKPMEGSDSPEGKYTQLLGGLIVDGKEYKPFIYYLSGKRLSPFWDFAKNTLSIFTHGSTPIPMYAIKLLLTTSEVETKWGTSFVIDFNLDKDESGNIQIISDEGLNVFMEDSLAKMEEMFENIIKHGANEESNIVDYIRGEEAKPSPSQAIPDKFAEAFDIK